MLWSKQQCWVLYELAGVGPFYWRYVGRLPCFFCWQHTVPPVQLLKMTFMTCKHKHCGTKTRSLVALCPATGTHASVPRQQLNQSSSIYLSMFTIDRVSVVCYGVQPRECRGIAASSPCQISISSKSHQSFVLLIHVYTYVRTYQVILFN